MQVFLLIAMLITIHRWFTQEPAVIGGSIMRMTPSSLAQPMTATDSRIVLRDGGAVIRDVIVIGHAGVEEFVKIDGAPVKTRHGFDYAVIRNLDGGGAKLWPAGTVTANTGHHQGSFVDIYR